MSDYPEFTWHQVAALGLPGGPLLGLAVVDMPLPWPSGWWEGSVQFGVLPRVWRYRGRWCRVRGRWLVVLGWPDTRRRKRRKRRKRERSRMRLMPTEIGAT